MNIPAIVIGGTQSGVGKTTVSLALMSAFAQTGCRVQAFKVGPDYIDPSYHQLATGRPSHNLDTWMLDSGTVKQLFARNAGKADLSIIEGVMGLFDGASSKEDTGSTAQAAKLLGAPVILVLDAQSLARSAAAMVLGYQTFDPALKIGGVILNRIGSAGHFEMLREAIEYSTGIPVLGALPRQPEIQIPERHLGLETAQENRAFGNRIQFLAELVKKKEEAGQPGIDLEKILKIAQEALPLDCFVGLQPPRNDSGSVIASEAKQSRDLIRIAIARDRAFSFYYQANLDLLEDLGAELVPFSPLEDDALPEDTNALFFGGGFPEIYADELQKNKKIKQAIRQSVERGMPVYAECGGLMFLAESIETLDGKIFDMAAVIPGKVKMTKRLQNLGYKEALVLKDSFLGKKDERFRGHEFHYSSWEPPADKAVHQATDRRGYSHLEGYASGSVYASYVHSHFLSYPDRAKRLIEAARKFNYENLYSSNQRISA